MGFPLFYKIKKDTDGKIEWMTNVTFDNPKGISVDLTPDKQHAFLLTKETAELFLKRVDDPAYSMEEAW